jgi:hypothetical protein
MIGNSREAIKSRMIRNASGLWGYPDSQDINSFDPLVGIIIGALSEELYSISGEIKMTDSRIVEKLYELLFNQNVFTHFPAHAIVHAETIFPQVTISESYQFNYIKKIQKTNNNDETVFNNKTIGFSPTSEIKLFKGEVKYIVAGNQIYEVSAQGKEPLSGPDTGAIPDFAKLYIGLKLDNQIDNIDGLSLMYLVRNKLNEDRFYSSISNARWKINDVDVNFIQGFELPQFERGNMLAEIIKRESDVSYKACNYVNEFYRSKFMIIDKQQNFLKKFAQSDTLPKEFNRKFSANVLKTVPGNIFWIEIQCSQPIAPEIIKDLTVSMNCFPVINREIHEVSQLLIKGINIIPLSTEDLFFDIKMVTDTKGTQYKHLNSIGNENSEEEGFMIRQGGIARFDSRDARETIKHLIDLIRDERASFSLLGTDLISSELRQLDQIISRLEQRLEAIEGSADSNSYLLLNTNSNYERANVQYWTTCGDLANNIKSSSRLTVSNGNDLDNKSVILITNSFGGRQKLSREDKLNKLRRSILSKGRVVTIEDIKALCFEHFGSELLEVEISKGVYLNPDTEKGLVRSLDIFLTIDKQHKYTEVELEQKTEELQIRLKLESINLLPFRIFIRK